MEHRPRHLVVVGGGISGLSAAHRLVTAAHPGAMRITVLDGADRLGGWVRTETFAGRPVDLGPDSLLVRMPWAAELAGELGLDDQLVAPGQSGAFLLSRG
ncbi:MAG: FAD-dependent oxidoreductase, partial [Patulibacter sp.]